MHRLMSLPTKQKRITTMTTMTNVDFGIRNGGDRAAVLNALLRAKGKNVPATKLVKLARGNTTARVARIVRRIEAKSKLYRLGFKVVRSDDAYALQPKR
jgi:hypothetical protein